MSLLIANFYGGRSFLEFPKQMFVELVVGYSSNLDIKLILTNTSIRPIKEDRKFNISNKTNIFHQHLTKYVKIFQILTKYDNILQILQNLTISENI